MNKEKHVGLRVSAARRSKNISQAVLAKRVGIKQSSLSEIESGKVQPRKSTLRSLARELSDDLGSEELRDYLASRPRATSVEIVEQLNRAIEHSEWFLDIFVLRFAEANPRFRAMLDVAAFETTEKRATAYRKMLDFLDDPNSLSEEEWNSVLEEFNREEDLPESIGDVEPADIILALDMGVVGDEEDDEESELRKAG